MMYCKIKDNNITGDYSNKIIPWWSFAKTIIATAVLKLVEQNKLDLNKKYFGNEATLHQVLRHEGGYGDYGGHKSYHELVKTHSEPWSDEEMIKITENQELIYKPGCGWQYSNIGYCLVKNLIEKTMNLSINDALQELIFHPLGLFDVKVAETKEDLKDCHYVREGYHPKYVYHGMIIGTIENACQFLNQLSQGRILSKGMLQTHQDTYDLDFDIGDRPWEKPSYALGIMVDNRGDENYSYGHTGVGPDSVIAIYHYPKTDPPQTIGVVINTYDQGKVEYKLKSLLD